MPMQENISIVLNGEAIQCPINLNFLELLNHLELEPRSLAIELNREILPKSEWENRQVENGDKIEIVQFVGGGL